LKWDQEKFAKALEAEKTLQTGALGWKKEEALGRMALEKELTTGALDWSKTKSANQIALEQELLTGRLGWDREKTIQALDLEKWKQGLLIDQAGRNDTKSTIGNVIGTVGSLANMFAMKQFMKR
jgi:hypothetical protein